MSILYTVVLRLSRGNVKLSEKSAKQAALFFYHVCFKAVKPLTTHFIYFSLTGINIFSYLNDVKVQTFVDYQK